MRSLPLSIGTIHFVGIGGIGMSGIAEVLHNLGYAVQGSDIADSANVRRLREAGIKVAIGHDAANLGNAQVVVVLPCVPPTAMAHFRRINSASISARRTTGISRARAAATSGLSRFTAVDVTTTVAVPRLAASWPTATGMPLSRRRRTLALSAMSLPCTA